MEDELEDELSLVVVVEDVETSSTVVGTDAVT